MKQFEGKTAVVTGAASGIGRALSRAFAAEGMQVAMVDIDAEALAESADQIRTDYPAVASMTRLCDVGDTAAMDDLAGAVFEQFGHVDVLCNNAGVFVGGLIWDRPPADFEFVLGANL